MSISYYNKHIKSILIILIIIIVTVIIKYNNNKSWKKLNIMNYEFY